MVITLTFAALIFFSPAGTERTVPHFSSPSHAWAYVNEPKDEWEKALKAGKVPKSSTPVAGEIQRRAREQCQAFELDSVSGEGLYWLAKLCENAGMFPKGLAAAENYLAGTNSAQKVEAHLLLAGLQMRTTGNWEAAWTTYRTILQADPISAEQELAVRVAIGEEADTNEATALTWSQERYSILLDRASNFKPGTDPLPYVWILMAGGDLVHRYYIAGQTDKARALLAELNQLKAAHPEGATGWAADYLNAANMEMNPAPQIPVLTAIGRQPGSNLVQKGRVEVVHFIFLRCSPCVTQLKYLDSLQKRYGKENLLVTNVTTYQAALQPDTPPHSDVDSALEKTRKKESPHLAMVVAPEKTLADYQVKSFPVLAIIDKEGRLRFEGIPDGFDEGEELDRLVRKLLAE